MSTSIANLGIRITASAAVLASTLLSTPVVNAQPPAVTNNNQCFYKHNINGFRAPDDRTVYIRIGVNAIYRLDLMVDCQSLAFRQNIGLESTPGDAWVCSPIQATVVYRDVGIRYRCPVSDIHKLTPAEIAALPKQDLP